MLCLVAVFLETVSLAALERSRVVSFVIHNYGYYLLLLQHDLRRKVRFSILQH